MSAVATVLTALQAFRDGGMEASLRYFDPDVEISDPERAGGPFIGHDALLRWTMDWMENWDEYEMELLAPVVTGDSVVALVHHKGRARASGIEFDQLGAQHYRVRDGLITYWRPYTDRGEALKAAGLRDPGRWLQAIDTVRAGYDAWNRRDFEALAPFLEGDAEVVPVRQSPDMAPFRGLEEGKQFWESSVATWETYTFTPLSFEPHGDELLVEVIATAKARGSGIELEENWAHLYALSDGEFVRLQAFTDVDDARATLAYPDPR